MILDTVLNKSEYDNLMENYQIKNGILFEDEGIDFWDYPLSETEYALENLSSNCMLVVVKENEKSYRLYEILKEIVKNI